MGTVCLAETSDEASHGAARTCASLYAARSRLKHARQSLPESESVTVPEPRGAPHRFWSAWLTDTVNIRSS